MAIRLVPYEPHHEAEVKAFNERLRAAGACPFPLGEHAPGETPAGALECGIEFQHFLAVDDGGAVRGGYFIRNQPFWIRGQVHPVGHFTSPLSEGIADKRFAGVGAMLLSHALKMQPLLFAMGMGNAENPLPRMLKAMGFTVLPVPFLFRVLNGSAFFRNVGVMRSSPLRSLAGSVLAGTGVGSLGMKVVHRVRRKASMDRNLKISAEAGFEAWADETWKLARGGFSFSAVRDARTLDCLYPRATELPPIRAVANGESRGWIQLMHCQPRNRSLFGDMRVMALVDGVAAPEAIPSLVLAAVEQAKRDRADLLFSNQLHADWTGALRNCGFLEGPSNYLLALSPKLKRMLEPLSETVPAIHFNRGDGDGRVNLQP